MPTIAIDCDGVLNMYDGWKGVDAPMPALRLGARGFLSELKNRGWHIVIYSCRPRKVLRRWLREVKINDYIDEVTSKKPIASVYLDDRAICFNGSFERALHEIENFEPHWKR